MFPERINKKDRAERIYMSTRDLHPGIIHTAHTTPEEMTLSHQFAHSLLCSPSLYTPFFFLVQPLPPFLPLTKQMEVSLDFHLNTSQGGATGLICMFWSEELSVWVTEVSLLTQLRGLSV